MIGQYFEKFAFDKLDELVEVDAEERLRAVTRPRPGETRQVAIQVELQQKTIIDK
jgi:hypothetical protein